MATPRENLTRKEARRRAALLDDIAYTVHLDLADGDDTFGATTRVEFACGEPGADAFIDLTAASVAAAALNGEPLPADLIEPTRLRLPDLEQGSNTLEVEARMAYRHEGRGLHRFEDPTDERIYLHSQFEPFDAHLVYPCFDQPDLKATFELSVDAPAGWVVVSNTAPVEQPDGDTPGRWRFRRTPRLSPYLTAVVAGGYESVHDSHRGTDLGLYVRHSLAEHLDAEALFDLTKRGLDWFTDNFGHPYPFGKYDQLFVPEFSAGAMENAGCVTFSESYVFRSKVTEAARERRAETLLHEMAHMWFGDLVTMRWWDDLWLKESFATFMATLASAEATRFTNAWVTFLDRLKAWAKYQDQLPTTHPVADDMPDTESVRQNFDGVTYAKGASVLRQLVAWVGQEEFLAGCRAFFDEHAWATAELADLLAALEATSGRELDSWGREWLSTSGVNTLRAELDTEDGRVTSFQLVQDAPDEHPVLRRHRLAVGVYDLVDGELVRTTRAEVDVRGEHTPVDELVGTPRGRLVLVNDDDLTYTKIRLTDRDMATMTQHLDVLADPLARALLWGAAWDMVRDAELPARRFADLVVANAAAETDVGVLQRLLGRAEGAAVRYGAPTNRDGLLAHLADWARGRLEQAEPGGDRQLAWARHWAGCASTPAQLEAVRAVLDGETSIEGLELDVDLRWHLVTCLAAAGAADEQDIDAELERDPTDLGQRKAATARAARPDRQAKERAFQRLLEDEELSHTMARQLWAGIQQLHQPEVLAGFDDRYLEALDTVWAQRSAEWAIEFTNGMFPHPLTSEELLAKIDRRLERDDLGGQQRRALLEQRDTLQRTLLARALDATVDADRQP